MRNERLPHDSYNRNDQPKHFYGKSLRLPDHDYSQPHVYHIVICAQGVGGRGPLFEHPVLRQLLQTNWLDLMERFPSIYLEALEIMPDHIHFIIWVNKWPHRLQGMPAPYLWQIIQAYKSTVAVDWLNYIKKNYPNQPARIWQTRYVDRMIRVGDLERVRLYIRANPDTKEAPHGCQGLYEYMGWEKPSQILDTQL